MYRGNYNGSGTAGVPVNVEIGEREKHARSRYFTLSFEGTGDITVTAIMEDGTVDQALDNNVITAGSGIYEFTANVKTIVLTGTASYDYFITAADA